MRVKLKKNNGGPPTRTARPGHRHRKDNGPQELQIEPVPPLDPKELGTLSRYTSEIIAGGPRALIAAEHKAAKLAAAFGAQFEAEWFLKTDYLRKLESGEILVAADSDPLSLPSHYGQVAMSEVSDATRARLRGLQLSNVRYALKWRPRYLAVYALSGSNLAAARAAKISFATAPAHRKVDPEFDAQCLAADEYATQLLHDVTLKSAIEGDYEPVFWQGIQVGHIKKVDNRLRIEMLRARMPQTFKTPGTKIAVAGQINNTIVFGDDQIREVQSLRAESLARIAEKKRLALPQE